MIKKAQPGTLYQAVKEISRLEQISEHQSLCLAQALFEKNKLAEEVANLKSRRDKTVYLHVPNPTDEKLVTENRDLEETLRRAQLDLLVAQEQLSSIKTTALLFSRSLGIGL